MNAPSVWRLARIVGGLLLAVAALYALVVNIDGSALWSALIQADLLWLAVAVVSVLLTLSLVTSRWGVLIADGRMTTRSAGTSRFCQLWDAVVIGQAVNILFPFRFGEGARVGVTCAGLGRDVGGVTVAIAIERALDVAAFGAALLLVVAAGGMPPAFERILPGALVLVVLTIAAVPLIVRLMPALLRSARRSFGPDSRAARWLGTQEASAQTAWADLARGRRRPAVVVLTALILLSSASTNFLVFRAFNLSVPLVAALVLLAVLQGGTALVSVPGNLGVFHYLTVVTLAVWQVPAPLALATAIVLHVVSLGPKVVLGGLALATLRLRERDANWLR